MMAVAATATTTTTAAGEVINTISCNVKSSVDQQASLRDVHGAPEQPFRRRER